VEHQVWNGGRGRPYSGGDAIGCFFAVIIGLFSIALISNQLKATVEAKVAANFIFEIIDRKPPIPINDPKAEKHTLEGSIEFDNIDFFYPTRPEQYILKGFKAKFHKG
jgi:ATP-binding cassette subfamily B (MDR/TAP) protein 1